MFSLQADKTCLLLSEVSVYDILFCEFAKFQSAETYVMSQLIFCPLDLYVHQDLCQPAFLQSARYVV
jgi:hypothetical protein